jgi:hypothetical protein
MYPFCLATLVQVLEKFYPKTVVHDFKEKIQALRKWTLFSVSIVSRPNTISSLFTVNRNEILATKTVWHEILLRHMIFA